MQGTDPTGVPYKQKGGYQTPDIVTEAVKRFDDSYHHHAYFVRNFNRRERGYRGILTATETAARWRHTMHQPFAFNMIETIIANTQEMGLDVAVHPAPIPGLKQEEAKELLAQASGVRNLIKQERRIDGFDAKQRPLFLCDSIGGRGIGKTYWGWNEATVKRQGVENVTVHDAQGNVLGVVPTIVEIEEKRLLKDHSTTEVCDPRDVILHESAQELDPRAPGGCQYLFHRNWYSMEQLRDLEKTGFISNVDYLSTFGGDYSGNTYSTRERELWKTNHLKDLVEVIEYWYFWRGQVWRMIYGNRSVQLRAPEANPFWHQTYPFFLVSSQPQPFSTLGCSDMELIEQIQAMLWELQNQRLDNLELINNAITLIRSDIDDPDVFQYYPGAFWPVDDVQQVAPYSPPYQIANITLEAEALLKADLQAVSSASPMAGGNDQGMGGTTSTATGASLIMTAAQARLAYKKWNAQQGLNVEAWQRLKNIQQFGSDSFLLHNMGPQGSMTFKELSILDVQGEFVFSIDQVGESQNRQERRAEASTIMQLMMQAFPMSYVSGTPIDLHEVLLWVMRSWDLEDESSAFFQPQQQPDPEMSNLLMGNAPRVQIRAQPDGQASDEIAQQAGALPAPQQGAPNMGTTSSTAVDASKPSATGGLSMSPAMMLQRASALAGSPGGR